MSLSCAAPSEHRDVSYDDRFGDSTTMDLYLPSGTSPRPAILMIHGGAWRAGSKQHYHDAAVRMARSGYVAAAINYRLGPAGAYPRGVQDCVCALAYLRAHAGDYGLDPDRVAVTGYSAGGHLAALLGVAAEAPEHIPDCDSGATGAPNAVISSAGVQDFHGKEHDWVSDFLGGSEDDVPEVYDDASPISHVTSGQPPLLMIAGGADWLVDTGDMSRMRDAMLAAGNDAELLLTNGGGHLLNPDENVGALDVEFADLTPEGWAAMGEFLERHLERP
ncbi:MAG TPA: alpha/beta hydrolase [Polyangiaceae bacterium]|nr:alpha/beta hydrolase [Polyangiaceae bacterium]